jgi:tRNA (cytidine/uridine-2'-O-)-methyltransferase
MDATGSPPEQLPESKPSSTRPNMHVVLYQPEIPQNTGNIGRTCVALGAKLWIVRPAGFRLDASQLKRAGLDYWQHLDWATVDSWEELLEQLPNHRYWLLTKFAQRPYYSVAFEREDVFVFGCETNGLPDKLRLQYAQQLLGIPMPGPVRSLNLATAAGIVMYTAACSAGLFNDYTANKAVV